MKYLCNFVCVIDGQKYPLYQKQLIDAMLKLNKDDKLIINYPCRSGRYFTKMMYNICYKTLYQIDLTEHEIKWLKEIKKG